MQLEREKELEDEETEAILAKENGKAVWQRVQTPKGSIIIRREAIKKTRRGIQVNFSKTGSLFKAESSFGTLTSLPGQSFDDFMEMVKGYLYESLSHRR